jgi:hypothetical protein
VASCKKKQFTTCNSTQCSTISKTS